MKKIFLLFIIFTNLINICNAQQAESITFLKPDTTSGSNNSPATLYSIIFQGPGIVLYKDYAPTFSEAENDGACMSASGYTYTRCGTFTVPTNHPYSKFNIGGWIQHDYCAPVTWSWSLRNSSNQLMPEPYYIAPGETYSYCLSATLAYTFCNVSTMCLTPSAKIVDYQLEHHNKYDNNYSLLNTLPDNSIFFPKNYASVCSDGSNASEFRITGTPATGSLNWKLRIAEDPNKLNIDTYGEFSQPVISSTSIAFTYKHPIIPPSGKYQEFHIEMIDANNSNAIIKSFVLRVYKTPLLFVHGKKDNGSAFDEMFNNFKNTNYETKLMLKADYKDTHNDHFETNKAVVPTHIERLIKIVLKEKISAGKIDIVAHSMGGLLSRMYLQDDAYKNNINKLITHNTPHSGSQAANRMADADFAATTSGQVARYFGDWGGAAMDLQVGSNGTIATTINAPPFKNKHSVPSHTIVTTHPYNPPVNTTSPGFDYVQIFKWLEMTPFQLFRTDASDLVVARASQTGGLTGAQTSLIQPQIHSAAQNNILVINRVLALLKESPKSNSFAQNGFQPIDTLRYIPPPVNNSLLLVPNGTIAINYPQNNKIVKIGSILNFNISGTNLQNIEVFLKDKDNHLVRLYSQTNSLIADVSINNTYNLGTNSFIAIGISTNGEPVYKIGSFEVVDCTNINYSLNGIIDVPYYQTTGTIVATGKVDLSQKISLNSQKSITLNPGFESERLTRFTATINPCSN